MATFGYTTIGASSETNNADFMMGTVFTVPYSGHAQSITVALKRAANGNNDANCAIYRHSTLALIGQTTAQTLTMTTAYQWFTFTFADPAAVVFTANVEYLLIVWVDYTVSNWSLAYTATGENQSHYTSSAYTGNFPNPLAGSNHIARIFSIYCTYLPTFDYDRPLVNEPSPLEKCIHNVMQSRGVGKQTAQDICVTEFHHILPEESEDAKAERIKRWMQQT